MNSIIDYTIIADFLSFPLRERIIYELSSPKKRMKALNRFSHNVDSIINSDYIYHKGKLINDTIKLEIKKSLSDCIVLSFEHPEGEKMLFEEAFDCLTRKYIFAVIITESWLIIKPEYEGGEELFYILKKQ